MWDVIIVGGGPAGLAAGVFARARDLSVLVLEARAFGGQLTLIYPTKTVYDYPGVLAAEARDLADLFLHHAKEAGCELKAGEEATDLVTRGDLLLVKARGGGSFEGKAVILASGMGIFEPKSLGVRGEEEFRDRGVHYHIEDRRAFKGQRVVFVGGGDTALENALTIAAAAREVTVVHRRDVFRAMEKNVEAVQRAPIKVLFNTEVKDILGRGSVEKVAVYNNVTGEERELPCDAVVVNIGFTTNVSVIRKWGLDLYGTLVKVNTDMSTSRRGVFACGDIVAYHGKDLRIGTAVGEAVLAAMAAYKYVRQPYWA